MVILQRQRVNRQEGVFTNVPVFVHTCRVRFPSGCRAAGHTKDAVRFVLVPVHRRLINSDIVAHGSVFGIIRITIICLWRKHSFAVGYRPGSDALLPIERGEFIEV